MTPPGAHPTEPPRRLPPSVPKGEPSHHAAPAPPRLGRTPRLARRKKCEPQDQNIGRKDEETRPPILQRKISVKLGTRTRVQATGGGSRRPHRPLCLGLERAASAADSWESGIRRTRSQDSFGPGIQDSSTRIRRTNPGDPGLPVSKESRASSAPPSPRHKKH